MKHFAVLPLALSALLGLATMAHAAIEPAQPASTYAGVQGGNEGFAQSVTDGSLLLMAGDTQQYWLHGINKMTRSLQGRINLTFRKIV